MAWWYDITALAMDLPEDVWSSWSILGIGLHNEALDPLTEGKTSSKLLCNPLGDSSKHNQFSFLSPEDVTKTNYQNCKHNYTGTSPVSFLGHWLVTNA